ncbi:MAG: hypothetical protein ACE5IP_06485 [Terriglobia bacterium]
MKGCVPPGMMYVLLCLLSGLVSPGPAQEPLACPTPPNKVKVQVNVAVSFDPATGLYTYHYTVTNDPTSEQEVDDFALDFSPPLSDITKPQGWREGFFRRGDTMHWSAVESAPLPADEPDTGQIPPPLFGIKPGSSLGGFSFKSPNPPAPVTFYVTGFAPLPAAPTEAEAESLMELCPEVSGTFFDVAVRGTTQGPATFVLVDIDIKPGSDPNSINLASSGVVPVAILSSSSFDATTVDPQTLTLAGASVRLLVKKEKFQCSQQDSNQDGLTDLVCQFNTAELELEPGDALAVLTAQTLAGQTIRGQDSVRVVPQ